LKGLVGGPLLVGGLGPWAHAPHKSGPGSVPTQIRRALVTGRRSTVVNSVDTVDPAELFLRSSSRLPSSVRQPAGSMPPAWDLSHESPTSQTVGVMASVVNPSHDSRVQTPGSTHMVLGEQSAATTPSE